MELVLLLEAMKDLHLTAVSIQRWTRKDTIHSSVNKYIQDGRPQNCSEEFRVFYNFKLELSTLSGCILCDCRVVITPQGRNQLLPELHQEHSGINKMKSLERMYSWWSKIDENIEKIVKGCSKYQENQMNVPTVPLQPWNGRLNPGLD